MCLVGPSGEPGWDGGVLTYLKGETVASCGLVFVQVIASSASTSQHFADLVTMGRYVFAGLRDG